ncbi:hypothetical protein [Dysgonomonas sp. UBA7698]|uniref:hypothetical protein n=1 Tax=Dysgonomonas sp. UBA7698 TaxID=1946427 RepID=UPI0025BA9655|nr:hypothetical protein [Dysgonomonas sp. UBA7698]
MAKRIEELEFALTKLLGKKSGTCQKKPGEGKDKGTNFYSLVFNDGTSAFISWGRSSYRTRLLLMINQFYYYNQHKDKLDLWIADVIKHDNITADWQKLPMLEFIGTRIDDNDQFVVFDYYMCISEEQKVKLTYKETGLSDYCKGKDKQWYEDNIKSFIYKY